MSTGLMPTRSVDLAILVALVLAPSHAAGQTISWQVTSEIVSISTPSINLRNREKGLVASVATSQLRRLYEIKEKIGAAAGLGFVALAVSSQNEPNAYAGARGDGTRTVTFTLGMLRLLGEDEGLIATVMGHEFGHLAKNHQGREGRTALTQVIGLIAGVAAGALIQNPFGSQAAAQGADLAGRAVIHSYDRDQEREADAFGIEIMSRAGYDPQAAPRYWSMIPRNSGGVFSTHPANEERLTNLQQLANRYNNSTQIPRGVAQRPASVPASAGPILDVIDGPTTNLDGVNFGIIEGRVTVLKIDMDTDTNLRERDHVIGCTFVSLPPAFALADLPRCKGDYVVSRGIERLVTHVRNRQPTRDAQAQ